LNPALEALSLCERNAIPKMTRKRVYPKVNRSARTADSLLDLIVRTKAEEVSDLVGRRAELRRLAESAAPARGFARALSLPDRVALIGEYKRRSPSAGALGGSAGPAAVAEAYLAAGAAALSVLTDMTYFGGTLEDLQNARAAVPLPVLRKDFVVDEIQLYEARAAGADAVLLIVRILERVRLGDLLSLSAQLGMDALLEVHTADELERALAAGARVIGVNNRDLATFVTDLRVTLELAPLVPADRLLVAESGIASAGDVQRLGAVGADAVLVGEALMRTDGAAAVALVGQPKAARSLQAETTWK
jgi:indole-3-glycerol phosphate synthase